MWRQPTQMRKWLLVTSKWHLCWYTFFNQDVWFLSSLLIYLHDWRVQPLDCWLWTVVLHMKAESTPSTMWIDALCFLFVMVPLLLKWGYIQGLATWLECRLHTACFCPDCIFWPWQEILLQRQSHFMRTQHQTSAQGCWQCHELS